MKNLVLEQEDIKSDGQYRITDFKCNLLSLRDYGVLSELARLAKNEQKKDEFLEELSRADKPAEVQQLYLKYNQQIRDFSKETKEKGLWGKFVIPPNEEFFDNLELILRVEGFCDWVRKDGGIAYEPTSSDRPGWVRVVWK